MLGKAADPLLEQTEQALIAKVPPQMKGALQKVLSAGLKILYAPQLAAQLKQKLATTDPVQSASQGAVNLFAELWKQSNRTIPKPVVVPSVVLFAFEYLDLAAKAGRIKITPQVIAQVTQLTTQALIKLTKSQQGQQQPGAGPSAGPAPAAGAAPAPSPGLVAGAMQGGA